MKSADNKKRIQQLESELSSYKSAVRELKILNEIAVAAGKATDVDQILNTIVQKTLKSFNAEQGLIYLITPKRDIFQNFIKIDDTSRLKHSYMISDNITGWVLLHEKSLLIENLSKDKRFNSTEKKGGIHSVLCSPIWFKGIIIGIILLVNKKDKKSFTKNELTLLSIIAAQAGQLIKNSQLQREAVIRMKEAEIAQLKSRFFTNISHEFRTPLTLILGPADKLISESPNNNFKKQAEMIRQNAVRLLGLINQLLDLSKLEAGKLKLELVNSNIVSFIKGFAQSFGLLAEQKDIKLKVSSEKENIAVSFDKDKMLKILSNLLSNALKFTRENGLIEISIKESIRFPDGGFIEISVSDNGIGIHNEDLPKLFDRFYQVDTMQTKKNGGTGIGLALTKELVDLHRGFIKVSSKFGEGSKFVIELPTGKDHFHENEIVSEETIFDEDSGFSKRMCEQIKIIEADSSIFHQINHSEDYPVDASFDKLQEDKLIILVVEDNTDVREFIKNSLEDEFVIDEAVNGEQGIRKAENKIPDLIISDILMPKMNGNELVKIIKNNEKTSHIPIILLTAKSEQESKLEGLESGADDYLTKPFDAKELRVRIKNLTNIRRNLQKRFSNRDFVSLKRGKGKKLNDLEEKFINKVAVIIENHFSEEEFSIEQFGKEAGMSRVQLHRKLKALSGKSASSYLRSFRLSKAKKMIEEQKGNVSEIAYFVGFSSPEYFTRCFKKEFGYPPSDMIN